MLVFAIFGFFQVQNEQRQLMDDLQRKAKNVTESMELSVRNVFFHNDIKTAKRLVDKFQKRERLQGCIIFTKEGKILAVTDWIADWNFTDKPYVLKVLETHSAYGGIDKFKEYSVYVYILPIYDEENNLLGFIEVVYDISYVFKTIANLWRTMSITLIILIILTTSLMLILQRQMFLLPLRQLTNWFHQFQKGEISEQLKVKNTGELGKFAQEVEQVALHLRVARKSVAEEATRRLSQDELWSEKKLKDLVRAKLGENALFIVSNREPYMHVINKNTNKPKCIRPASGVVTALDPIMRACGGLWLAHGSGTADKRFVNSRNKLGVPPDDIHYILKRVWFSKEEEDGYYYGFSNECLWPLCHNTHTRPVFNEMDWQQYKKVNQKFADSLIEELPITAPYIFIQDYHFTLLPQMIKEKRPDAIIALFWHIPWPNPEVFSICPYKTEILEGMLGCDLIGFHVQYHCNNFLDTANRLLECRIDMAKFTIVRNNKETLIKAFPISIDPELISHDKITIGQEVARIRQELELEKKIIALSIERIDYTKGIVERFHAIDRFLDKYPAYKNNFIFIQLAAPSRTHIQRYQDLMNEIDKTVEEINWKHADGTWQPIVYLKRHFSIDELKPFYALADLCLVSSLHDGMNLVAKEYIAAKTDCTGALILSQFTGAARELTDATLINPYSTEEFADSIKYTLELPAEEKQRRMENMRKVIAENNVYRWAGTLISELTTLKKV